MVAGRAAANRQQGLARSKNGGRKHSDESKAKISETNKLRMTDDRRAKISRDTSCGWPILQCASAARTECERRQVGIFELQTMMAAWKAARPDARKRFLTAVTNADI